MSRIRIWPAVVAASVSLIAGCTPRRGPAPPAYLTNALMRRMTLCAAPAVRPESSTTNTACTPSYGGADAVISDIAAFAASVVSPASSVCPDITCLTISQAHTLVVASIPFGPHTFNTVSDISKRCRSFEAGFHVLSSLFCRALSDPDVPLDKAAYLGRDYIRFCLRHEATADALALCDVVEPLCAEDLLGTALVKENRVMACNMAGDFDGAEKAARDLFLLLRDQPARMPDGSPLSFYLDALINAGKYRAARKLVDTIKSSQHPWAHIITPAREELLRHPPANKIRYSMPFEH